MLTVLASLPFVAGLAAALVLLGRMFKDEGAKIRAALAGHSLLAEPVMTTRPVKVRIVSRSRVSRPLRSTPLLRAAA